MEGTPIDINELFGEDGYNPEVPKEEAKPEPVEQVAEQVTEQEEEEEGAETEPTVSLPDFLLKAGILSDDPGEVDEETLLDLVQQETESYVQEALTATFESWKQKLPSNVMGLVQHTFNGGDADEYMKTWNETPLQLFDIGTESGQESFLRFYYKTTEGLEGEELDDKMDYHIDRGNVETAAKRFYQKLANERDKKLEALAKQQVEAKAQAERQSLERKQKLAQGMSKVKEFAGYQFPEGEKTVLVRYATRPVLVDGKPFSSGLAADLYEALSDPSKVLLLSKLVKNGFDTSFIEAKGKTKAVKAVKKVLQEPATPPILEDGVIWD